MQFLSAIALLGLSATSVFAAPSSNAGAVANVERDTTVLTNTYTTVSTLKVAVVDDVTSISTLVNSTALTVVGPSSLASEIVIDLEKIVGSITFAVAEILANTLPAVLELVGDVVAVVEGIVFDLVDIVSEIVNTLEYLIVHLVEDVLVLVEAELKAVFCLLAPLLIPILSFVGTLHSGDASALGDVSQAATNLVSFTNTFLSSKGLEIIQW